MSGEANTEEARQAYVRSDFVRACSAGSCGLSGSAIVPSVGVTLRMSAVNHRQIWSRRQIFGDTTTINEVFFLGESEDEMEATTPEVVAGGRAGEGTPRPVCFVFLESPAQIAVACVESKSGLTNRGKPRRYNVPTALNHSRAPSRTLVPFLRGAFILLILVRRV